MNNNRIIIIGGPTGVGKSECAEILAQKINGEIINADQGQFYEALSIGTAKPKWKESIIKQHLFDSITRPEYTDAATYQQRANLCVDDIKSRGKTAIIVGGSGFYYQTLLFRFDAINKTVLNFNKRSEKSWQDLAVIDPERAAKINSNDIYRINRALNLYDTGLIPSKRRMSYAPHTDYLLVHVTRDRDDLHQRINKRVRTMLNEGWLAEVEGLSDEWKRFATVKKIIGYSQILSFLAGQRPYESIVEEIQQKTRSYAKKQKTFFRSIVKRIPAEDQQKVLEINLTLSSFDLYINQLIERFNDWSRV